MHAGIHIHLKKREQEIYLGTTEIARQLIQITPAEDLSSILSTLGILRPPVTPAPRGSNVSGLLKHLHSRAPHPYIIKNKIKETHRYCKLSLTHFSLINLANTAEIFCHTNNFSSSRRDFEVTKAPLFWNAPTGINHL